MNVISMKDRKETVNSMIDALFNRIDKIPHLTCGEASLIMQLHDKKEESSIKYTAEEINPLKELYKDYKKYL